jgi:hypothetical protein
MAGARDIPADHHVARYCHPQRGVVRDPSTKAILGLWPQAFELRSRNVTLPTGQVQIQREAYLSLNYFEHFGHDLANQLLEILATMRAKFKRPPEPVIARLNVGRIIACGTANNRLLRVRRKFSKTDPSYAALEGLPLDNSDHNLLTQMAQRAWVAIYTSDQILNPAVAPPPVTN